MKNLKYKIKFRKIINKHFLQIYKKCFKIKLIKNKTIKIEFLKNETKLFINEKFLSNMHYEIIQQIPINNYKLLKKLLKNYFCSKKFYDKMEKINKKYEIDKKDNIINYSKEYSLKKVYSFFDFEELENEIFLISNSNNFIYFLKSNNTIILQNLSLLLILTIILWLSNL